MATIPKEQVDTVRPVLQQSHVHNTGQVFDAATARPRFDVPLTPNVRLNLNHINQNGDWGTAHKKFYAFVKAWEQTAVAGKEFYRLIYKVLIPAAEALFLATPEIDCNFGDSEIAPHKLLNRMVEWQQTFDPSPTLANAIGSVENRKFNDHMDWIKRLPGWIFRFQPIVKQPGMTDLE